VASSSWRLVLDARAARDLKSLERQHHPVLSELIHAIDSLPAHPYAGKPLKGSKRGSYSLRVGDFRIIYDLYPDAQTVHVIRAGDRKEIYR
jgi:mRNA interferase RelE/StbE